MKLFILLAFSILPASLIAQTAIDSVKATINNLFTAMKTSDSAMLRSAFADSAVLQTIQKDKTGNIRIKNESVMDFASFIGKQEKMSVDEQIIFEVVKTDADLAFAWTPYKFYFKNKFSHCGVNSFQLVRIKNIWKIQYLIDTRRNTGCN